MCVFIFLFYFLFCVFYYLAFYQTYMLYGHYLLYAKMYELIQNIKITKPLTRDLF